MIKTNNFNNLDNNLLSKYNISNIEKSNCIDIEKDIEKIEKVRSNNSKELKKIDIYNLYIYYTYTNNNNLFLIDIIKLLNASFSVYVKRFLDNLEKDIVFSKIGILKNKIKNSDFYLDIETILYTLPKNTIIYEKLKNSKVYNNIDFKNYNIFKDTIFFYINKYLNSNTLYKNSIEKTKNLILDTILNNFAILDTETDFLEKTKNLFNIETIQDKKETKKSK